MSRTLNVEAEQAVLAGLMRWPEAWDVVGDTLVEADFANAGHRAVFSTLERLIGACKEIDAVSVHAAMNERGARDVMAFADLDYLAQFDVRRGTMRRYAEIVRVAALERALLAAIDEAGEAALGDGTYEDRLEAIAAKFSAMGHRTSRGGPRPFSELLVERIDHYTAMSEGEACGAWATRIPTLDTLLAGGLRPGKVYVIAAQPKMGKTSFAAQIVLNLAKHEGLESLVLTQEMPDTEVMDRTVANLGLVDYTSIQTGQFIDADWSALTEAVELGAKLPVWVDDQAGLTLADIRAKARGIKGLKLLVLDYVQLCSGSASKGATNRNAEIEQISRGVKVLAKELGIAVLLLSQLNREVAKRADKRPQISDLRDSGSIEQDADAVIFLWPVRDFENHGHRLVGCAVAANRSGPNGEFGLDFQGAYQRWAESDQDIRREAQTSIARGRDKHLD